MLNVLIWISGLCFAAAGLVLVFGRISKKRKDRRRAALGLPPEVVEAPPMPKGAGKVVLAWLVIIAFAIFMFYALFVRGA